MSFAGRPVSARHSLAQSIEKRVEALEHPFPYADCRALLSEGLDASHAGLVPDLDLYFGLVFGYASQARRMLHWSPAETLAAKKELASSFFDRQPAYRSLQPRITAHDVPHLWRRLELTEVVREQLLELLSADE